MKGYLKLHRQMVDNPIVYKDAEHLAIWIHLLIHAQFHECDAVFGGEKITLRPGQLITGRKKISEQLSVPESKVPRILSRFESEHQIEQRTCPQGRLITIVSWDKYQYVEQPNEQRMNNERTTTEQRVNNKVNTIQEIDKEYKNIRNKELLSYAGNDSEKSGWKGQWTYADPQTGRIRFDIDKARKERGV